MIEEADIVDATRQSIVRLSRSSVRFERLVAGLRALGRTAVVGGAARDWLLSEEPRDLDFVVAVAPAEIRRLAENWEFTKTGLGGYRIAVDGIKCDVWSLPTTWALRHDRSLPANLSSLPRTAFLNIDAIAIDLGDWTVHQRGFLDAVRTRVIDVNYERNPRPAVCVAHALKATRRYGFRLGPRLVRFMLRILGTQVSWDSVSETYASRYGECLSWVDFRETIRESCPPIAAKRLIDRTAIGVARH